MDYSPPKAGWSFMTLCFIPTSLILRFFLINVNVLQVSVVGFFILKICLDFSYDEEKLH